MASRTLLALPDAAAPLLHLVDSTRWTNLPPLRLPSPARRLLAHPAGTPILLWLDDALLALDRETLQPLAHWRADGPIAALDVGIDGHPVFVRREGGGGWLLTPTLQPLRRIDAAP